MDTEYGLDSRYKSKTERESDATVLMEARLQRLKNLSKEQIIKARLMQLKLKMEENLRIKKLGISRVKSTKSQ